MGPAIERRLNKNKPDGRQRAKNYGDKIDSAVAGSAKKLLNLGKKHSF
jgi:hypothetical protein